MRERERITAQIAEMQNTLDRLNARIHRYEQDIIPAAKELVMSE